jgi:LPS-assembly protein
LYNTRSSLFSLAGAAFGASYSDDCTTVSLNYINVYNQNVLGAVYRNQIVLASIKLRTLGDTKFQTSLTPQKTQDGL